MIADRVSGSAGLRGLVARAVLAGALAFAAPAQADPSFVLRDRVDALRRGAVATLAGAPVARPGALSYVYAELGYEPIWVRPWGARQLDGLLAAIDGAVADGLLPRDYHRARLEQLRARPSGVERRATWAGAELELLASDAFLRLGTHLTTGKVRAPDPLAVDEGDPEAMAPLLALLRVADGAAPAAALAALRPDDFGYDIMRRRLRVLRDLAPAEPPPVPAGPTLRPGDRALRVAQLRRRLRWLGELGGGGDPARADRYDEPLRRAVVRFQARHGLRNDAVVGTRTLAALNWGARERADRLRVNMERVRWLPPTLGARHVAVNIAAYRLRYVEPGREPLRMRAVVGEPYRQTPILASRITRIVLNPAWWVPRSIAVEELLPRLQDDPAALEAQGFAAVRAPAHGAAPAIAPTAIDWRGYSADDFPFLLYQKPGPRNALGRVKFLFPNAHDVYLHDTPDRYLFTRSTRAVSHGCIRLEHPVELAYRLLGVEPGADADPIARILASAEQTFLALERPVPVYVLYLTAWPEERALQWREDIYQRDRAVLDALDAPA